MSDDAVKHPVKSKRELLMEGMSTRHPDRTFADDEELFGTISDDYSEYDNKVKGYQEREKAFSELLSSDERGAGILMSMKRGEDPILYLIREFGPDISERLSDPKFQEQVEKAGKEYAEKIAESKKYDEEYSTNVQATLKAIEEYQSENGLSDEEVDTIMESLSAIARDFVSGKVTSDTIKMVSNAINYDTDVENAGQEGEVRGRNAKIEEKLRKARKGDGTAGLDGHNGNSGSRDKTSYGALDKFAGGGSIWERGGEKRTKY